ncbi:MAG: hypothetical protein LJE91_11465 [Gammaproteobacteria bacterium]|nr:hypothetical protein [Gammaproteobacteria bacterium]
MTRLARDQYTATAFSRRPRERPITDLLLLLLILPMTGCATYSDKLANVPWEIEARCAEVRKAIYDTHECEGAGSLLCNMQLGIIEHRCANYTQSNAVLSRADAIAEEQYTIRGSRELQKIILNPGTAPYRGSAYEWVYISYLKALNYLGEARHASNGSERQRALEEARVEIRRVDIKLRDIEARKGTYKEAASRSEDTFGQMFRLYNGLQGNWVDNATLEYREDAYIRYLSGVVYEMLGEWDDARVAYQKAATLYDEGYTNQYDLDEDMAEQAWFDTVRIMRRGGYGDEWKRISRTHLSPARQRELAELDPDAAQLIVIEHFGRVPPTGELNLLLSVIPQYQQLVLRPVPTGSMEDQRAQLEWFFMVYADTGILKWIRKYNHGGIQAVARSPVEKTIFARPAWHLLTELKVPQAIQTVGGVRVAVPYKKPLPDSVGSSSLRIDGAEVATLDRAESVAHLAQATQLRRSGLEIWSSVAGATTKLAACSAPTPDDWLIACSLVASALARAETRNWALLPYTVRLKRVFLDPGNHQAELVALDRGGQKLDREYTSLDLDSGDIKVWSVFTTMFPTATTPPRSAGAAPVQSTSAGYAPPAPAPAAAGAPPSPAPPAQHPRQRRTSSNAGRAFGSILKAVTESLDDVLEKGLR